MVIDESDTFGLLEGKNYNICTDRKTASFNKIELNCDGAEHPYQNKIITTRRRKRKKKDK